MPTDASAGSGESSAEEASDGAAHGELLFVPHDLRRDREGAEAARNQDLGFTVAPRPAERPADAGTSETFVEVEPAPPPSAAPAGDSFVIAQSDAAVPVPSGERPPHSFRIDTSAAPPGHGSPSEPPWVVREPETATASRKGWATRQAGTADPSTRAAVLRLREEAVHVSWQAAWLAMTSTERRRRRGSSR